MVQKRNHVPHFIEDNVGEEDEVQPGKSSSDGGEDDDDEEVVDDDEEEVEEGDEEEVEDDDEEEVEDDDEEEVEDDDEEEAEEDEEDEDEKEVEEDDDDDLEDDEDNEEFSSKESIRELLEPFGKEKLVEIFKEAALKNSALLSRVLSAYDSDPDYRRIFVHGLAADATSEAVAAAFSPFGQIEDCRVIVNLKTGQCKGYAFVVFQSRAAATRALKNPLKQIGSRKTNCHLASCGPQASGGKPSSEVSCRKIIVNNVSDKVNPEGLRTFFSKFGEIEEGPLGYDQVSRRLRGFAIFVYKTEEGCKKVLEEPKKYFEGCEMYCSRAPELHNKNGNTQTTTLAGAQLSSSSLQANDLHLNYASPAMLMGQNLGPGPGTWMGHNLGSGSRLCPGSILAKGQHPLGRM